MARSPRRQDQAAPPASDGAASAAGSHECGDGDWPRGRYRLAQAHYMAPTPQAEHKLVLKEGAEVEFAGRPSQAMIPLDAPARAATARRAAELRQQEEKA